MFSLLLLLPCLVWGEPSDGPNTIANDIGISRSLTVLNRVTEEIAEAYSNDPNYTISSDEEKIVIKQRTPPSQDPVDPEEMEKVENRDTGFHMNYGFGSSVIGQKSFEKIKPDAPVSYKDRANRIEIEWGIKPQVKGLKRFMVGANLGLETSGELKTTGDSHLLARAHSFHKPDFSYFGNWDVLVLNRARAFLSAGVRHQNYNGVHLSPNGEMSIKKLWEPQVQLRWRQMLKLGNSEQFGYYVEMRRSSNNTKTLVFGLTLVAGSNWPWVKGKKQK